MRKTQAAVTLAIVGILGGIGTHAPLAKASTPSLSGTAIAHTALKYLGLHYDRNGTSPQTGFNDLSFVRYVYARRHIALRAGAAGHVYSRLLKDGPRVVMANLEPGDILFFKNTVFSGLSHVGIYLGGGKFVHAEWFNYGVTVTSLENDARDGNYWAKHYVTANRPWSGG